MDSLVFPADRTLVPARKTSTKITTSESKALLRRKLITENIVSAQVADRMEIMFELMRLAPRLVRDYESIHRRRGWTYAGFRIANQLWALGDLEPGELARLTGASRASISSALNTLEASGFISRSIDPGDRRAVKVSLTAKGRTSLHSAIADQADRERAWLDILSRDERELLGKMLTRLAEQSRPE